MKASEITMSNNWVCHKNHVVPYLVKCILGLNYLNIMLAKYF